MRNKTKHEDDVRYEHITITLTLTLSLTFTLILTLSLTSNPDPHPVTKHKPSQCNPNPHLRLIGAVKHGLYTMAPPYFDHEMVTISRGGVGLGIGISMAPPYFDHEMVVAQFE